MYCCFCCCCFGYSYFLLLVVLLSCFLLFVLIILCLVVVEIKLTWHQGQTNNLYNRYWFIGIFQKIGIDMLCLDLFGFRLNLCFVGLLSWDFVIFCLFINATHVLVISDFISCEFTITYVLFYFQECTNQYKFTIPYFL